MDAYADGDWANCMALLRILIFFSAFRSQGTRAQCTLLHSLSLMPIKRGLLTGDRFIAAMGGRPVLPPNLEGALASPESMLTELRSRISCGCLQPRT